MSDTETCHVVVLGFDPQLEPPAARLQRVFGLDRATCEALLESLPATVQRSVPRVRAEYFRRALLSIGAQVEVRTPGGELVEAQPGPVSSPPPQAVGSAAEPPPLLQPPPREGAIALHAALTEPLPQLAPAPSEWSAQPSPWAVDPTSRTLAQAAPPQIPAPAAAELPAAPLGWNDPSPFSPAVGPAEPTAFVGPPVGMPAPGPPPPLAAGWPTAPVPIPQPELRAPAAPTLREAPAPTAQPAYASPPAAHPAQPFAAPPTAYAVPAPGQPASAPYAPPLFAPAPAAPAPFGAPPPQAGPTPPSAPTAWGGGLDLASLRPAQPSPFSLSPGAAPLPVPPAPLPAPPGASAPPSGLGARLPSDIWDAPVADSAHAASRDPSGIYDPPAASRPLAGMSVPIPAPVSMPPRDAGRPSSRPGSPRPSAPPPAALERALRSSEPAPPGAAADPAAFQVLHGWEELRDEFKPGAPRPGPRVAEPTSSAAPHARPASRVAAPATSVATPRPSARSVQGADRRTFWQSFGDALALPFTGPGPYWIAAITVWSVAVGVLGLLASFMFVLGLIVSFCAQTSLVAMACDYYRVCFWAPAVGERVLDRAPDFDPSRIMSDYVGRGLHLSFFVLLSQVAAIAWVAMSVFDGAEPSDLLLDPITWVLFFFPYFYWPMGVALTALRNDFGGIWHVLVGVRAIARAPLEYLAVVFVGFAVLAVSAIALFLLGSMLGLTGTILSGTLGLPLALSHGIQGALMGHLVRARAEIFEE